MWFGLKRALYASGGLFNTPQVVDEALRNSTVQPDRVFMFLGHTLRRLIVAGLWRQEFIVLHRETSQWYDSPADIVAGVGAC